MCRPRGKIVLHYSVETQGKDWTILQCADLGERLDHTTVYRLRGKVGPYYSVQTKGKVEPYYSVQTQGKDWTIL